MPNRMVTAVLAGAGLALLPWILVLAQAPGSAGWVALDVMEAGCLLGGAALLRRGAAALGAARAVAALAAGLLLLDAAVDLTTAGSAWPVAVAMALGAELPLAALCGRLALRGVQVPRATPELALAA
ncbi:hypothetical protein C7C46_29735 [Streptomyces tateyamensis]|uniref:DUF4345 domain-containing protein n=1 Tax=Streptomyces tateyamensis TaxID=565073 RepID=A0A2V4N8E1_9ACTN|nr:hypothetical protein [Streptomyces tateyamensis]PYC68037.1 hypothetical protein C7C46_29735 [Streptomyces tateyamensis]